MRIGSRPNPPARRATLRALLLVLALPCAASPTLADTVLDYDFENAAGDFQNAPEYIAAGLSIGSGVGWDATGAGPDYGPGSGGGAALYARGFNGTAEAMTLVNFTVDPGYSLELTGYEFDLVADAHAGSYFNVYIIPLNPGGPPIGLGVGVPIVRDGVYHTFTPATGAPAVLPVTLGAGTYNIALAFGLGVAGGTGYVGLDNFTLQGTNSGNGGGGDPPSGEPVGLGSYSNAVPPGYSGPSNSSGNPIPPLRTDSVTGPMPTGDWWSSLAWPFFVGDPQAPYSSLLQADPLAFKTQTAGLDVSYPTQVYTGQEYHYRFARDLTIGVTGLAAPATLVDGYSDWTVTAYWTSGSNVLRATIGHGLPFVYCTKSGGNAQVAFAASPTIWYNQNGVVAATVNGHHYAIFGPTGSSWTGTATLQSNLGGQDYFSLALLPDNSVATLDFYRQFAYAFVTDTHVSWTYDEPTAQLTTVYDVTTTPKEGAATGTLMALYRHQWLNVAEPLTAYTYISSRGSMKVRAGTSFSTVMTFNGVLPALPDVGTYNRAQLFDYVDEIHGTGNQVPAGLDTYWSGKAMGRAAALVPIADQVGHTAARDHFLNDIKNALEDWLTFSDGEADTFFAYDASWGALIGYPASYGTDRELNDHHFHYGYFLVAAATVARYDPDWVNDENWGAMLRLLARDAATGDHDDPLFPWLRNYDPYAGHAWACGHAAFGAGNNQESASESINFSTGLILLGAALGDTAMRDQGIFMYANEARAIDQYWYDVDELVFPPDFNHAALAILWADGGAYATWFSGAPEAIHGITFLPITGGSLYLGRDPAYVLTNYLDMVAYNGGPEDQWHDIIWSYLALADPGLAVAKFAANPNYTPEEGETRAHTYHWIHNLNTLGQVDSTVTADTPTYAVFDRDGQRTYVAYNASDSVLAVHFSDGMLLNVAPRDLLVEPAPDCSGVLGFSRFTDFVTCMQGPNVGAPGACLCSRFDADDDADLADFTLLQAAYAGGSD